MANNIKIDYTKRDYDSLVTSLKNYAKTRFPDKFTYLNDASGDMIYLEMLAYIGDTLNYQIDKSFNENFRLTAQNREAILRIADNLGFYNYFAKPSMTQATISITVPPSMNDENSAIIPNPDFLISIAPGLIAESSGVKFECLDEINFASDYLRTIITNYDSNGQVKDFSVNKTIILKAGETKYQRYYVDSSNNKPFMEIYINDTEITEVLSVVEVPGNVLALPDESAFRDYNNCYLEVKDLSEEKVFISLSENDNDDLELQQLVNAYTDMSINYGKWINKPNRFIVRRDVSGRTKITFGNNIVNQNSWQNLIGSSDLATLGTFSINQILNSSSLGNIPQIDTTLFIQYRSGAGIKTNVLENDINNITSKTFNELPYDVDNAILTTVRNSLKITANIPAVGGSDEMTNTELKQYMGKVFAANDRIVSYDDIINMLSTMPPNFGSIFKVSYEEVKPKVMTYSMIQNYVKKKLQELSELKLNTERNNKIFEINTFLSTLPTQPVDIINNSLVSFQDNTEGVLDNVNSLWLGEKCRLYILGLDKNYNLTGVYKNSNGEFKSKNEYLKQNIKRFLENKKVIGDWVDIVDANIINFQVEFTIIADNQNKQQVLAQCLNNLKNYFSVFNWNINQPIYVSNVQNAIMQTQGVINVVSLKFYNLFGQDISSGKKYSEAEIGTYWNNTGLATNTANNRFEMGTINNVIVSRPSDVFNIKYPNDDIIGKVI